MILVKKYRDSHGYVLVLCDKNLYGKKFEEGEFVLELNEFFNGEEKEMIDEKDFEDIYFIYAVGEESINILKEKKIIDEKDIKRIAGIPYTFVIYL
ncbi:MAG: DUF424 family protein [Candidatus Nanopusillus sp.]